MSQGFLQRRTHSLRQSVQDSVCALYRVVVFLVPPSLKALRADGLLVMCSTSLSAALSYLPDPAGCRQRQAYPHVRGETRCTAVCRVLVYHSPLTPPPVHPSPPASSVTESTVSHAWSSDDVHLGCQGHGI